MKRSSFRFLPATSLIAVAVLGFTACGSGDKNAAGNSASSTASSAGGVSKGADLTGAGSTFASALYSKWSSEYDDTKGIKVNYESIGSSGGIRQFSEQTVDFGATDGPMTDDEIAKAKGGPVLHLPIALGAVAITYNLPTVTSPLKLSGDLIADIFLGKVAKWNDARIAALNPGISLPAQDVLVVHRYDGSGTTFVLTDFLAAVSPEWASTVGRAKDVKWPTGLGGKGNDGVASQVKLTPGSVGYVELAYAKKIGLPVAKVRNSSGAFITPTVESVTAAAASIAGKLSPNTDYRISIVNAPGAGAYPISTFTWILAYTVQREANKGMKLIDFIRWGLTDGQAFEAGLNYAPLPASMTKALLQRVDSIKIGS